MATATETPDAEAPDVKKTKAQIEAELIQPLFPSNPKKPLSGIKYIDVADVWVPYPVMPPDPPLIESVHQMGVLEPIAVRENERDGKPYQVIDGARRVQLTIDNGWKQIPASIRSGDAYATALSTHTTRSDNPAAELFMIEDLISRGLGQREILSATRMPIATIRKRLGLQRLVPRLREPFDRGEIKVNIAEAAAKMPEPTQLRLAAKFEAAQYKDGVEYHRLTVADIKEERQAQRQDQASQAGLPDAGDDDDFVSRADVVEAFTVLWEEVKRNGLSIKDEAWEVISNVLEGLGLEESTDEVGEKVPAVPGGYVKELADGD